MDTNNNKSSNFSSIFNKIREFEIERPSNRWIAGVCAGIANRLGINVFVIRALFIISPFISFGTTLLFYIFLWLILPDSTRAGKIILEGNNSSHYVNNTSSNDNIYANKHTMNNNYAYSTPNSYPAENNKYIYEQPIHKTNTNIPRVSSSYNWSIVGIILVIFSITSAYTLFFNNNSFIGRITVALITIILGLSILFAGINGKKSTGITVSAILFTLFITLPTGVFYASKPYILEQNHYYSKYIPDELVSYKIIDLDNYSNKNPNENGEITINLDSFIGNNTIVSKGKAVKIVINDNLASGVELFSTQKWLMNHENVWKPIRSSQDNTYTVKKYNESSSIESLGFYNYDGSPIVKTHEHFTSNNVHEIEDKDYTYKVSEIKTENFDKSTNKYVINVNSALNELNVVDLSDHWFGIVEENNNDSNNVNFKYLVSSSNGNWSKELPTYLENKDNFANLNPKDINISSDELNNLSNNLLTAYSIKNSSMHDSDNYIDYFEHLYNYRNLNNLLVHHPNINSILDYYEYNDNDFYDNDYYYDEENDEYY